MGIKVRGPWVKDIQVRVLKELKKGNQKRPFKRPKPKSKAAENSYFSDCERDDKGRCLPSGDGGEESLADRKETYKPNEDEENARKRTWDKSDAIARGLLHFQRELTEEEISGLEEYSGERYKRMNRSLRQDGYQPGKNPTIDGIQSAASQPLTMPTVVYRGVSERIGNQILSGDMYEARGFVSTSVDPDEATEFNRWHKGERTLLEITAKTGVVLGDLSRHREELEVVQAHGTRYRVKGLSRREMGRSYRRQTMNIISVEEV